MTISESSEKLNNIFFNISVFSEESETDKTALYNYFLCEYGEKTISPFMENNTYETINAVLTIKFSERWKRLKEIYYNEDVTPITRTETTEEKTHTNIYGFNDETGVNDSEVTHTINREIENSDIYTNFQKSVAFYRNFSYYGNVLTDLASELTTMIYE